MGLFLAAVRTVTAILRLSAVTTCIIYSIGLMTLTVAIQLFQKPNNQ